MAPNNNYGNDPPNRNRVPGKGAAIASLVLGIVSLVFWFLSYSAFLSIVCGMAGLILASIAKKKGFTGDIRLAGFVLSLLGLVGGVLVFIACIGCAGVFSFALATFYAY